jgi:hypothetical protein
LLVAIGVSALSLSGQRPAQAGRSGPYDVTSA